ncbi:MAG TPA: hypothetical protein VF265_03125 [Nevskiaceae bacterium]
MVGEPDDWERRRRKMRWRNLGGAVVLGAIALALYAAIFWRWSHHAPAVDGSGAASASSASHAGRY